MNLDGKVVLITGAGSGMGRAAAELFAAHGGRIVCADISDEAVDRVVATIREAGGTAVGAVTDVAVADQVERAVATATSEWGRLDVLYNNAGLWLVGANGYVEGVTDGPAPLLTEDVWDRTLNVNLKGTYLGCRFAIPAMRETGGGSIINVSSVAALRVGRGSSDAYTAAKGGVLAMTRSLAVEHASEQIRVNCILPGAIATPMTQQLSDTARDGAVDLIPLGRWGTPEDIANMALFLSSDMASYCTGQMFVVDGGYAAL